MGKYDVDFYDDPNGEVLRGRVPNPQDLPEFIKTAEVLDHAARDQLPDDVFALILHDRGKTMRKFACVDPGNTALSVIYFLENADLLPEPAKKVAAVNLYQACLAHQIDPPALLEREVTHGAGKVKEAGVNFVDVSGLIPFTRRRASEDFALVKEGSAQYPIDDMESVDRAIRYFEDNMREFEPSDRHLYCIKVAAAADHFGLPVPEVMLDYASRSRAPDGHVKVAVLSRRRNFHEDAPERALLEQMAKVASAMPPEVLAATLEEFDRGTGLHHRWDGAVLDPYLSAFAREKVASWSFTHDGRTIDAEKLASVAQDTDRVGGVLGPDVAEGLADSPEETFDSLPNPHKLIIMNMAGA